MTLAMAKAKANETFIVQASLKMKIYYRQNIYIVHATFTNVRNDLQCLSLAGSSSLV
jgi:hypothetical protein